MDVVYCLKSMNSFQSQTPKNKTMFTTTYYLSVLAATLGASTQFYSYGIVNQEQALLLRWINTTYTNRGLQLTSSELNFLWSFIVSSIAIGAIPGALLTRTLAERYGRKTTLVANGVVNILAATAEFSAKYCNSPELLIVGRIVLGACIGLTSGIVPMYLIELTPPDYRNRVGTLHQVAVAFSEVFSLFLGMPEIFGSDRLWPLSFGFPGLLAFFLVVLLPFCPESPKYLERLGTYRELFSRREFRLPLTISLALMFAQQFSGCSAVFAYSTNMFLSANVGEQKARFSTLFVACGYFASAVSAPFLIDRVGRRRLTIFQLSFVTLSLSSLSIFTWLQQQHAKPDIASGHSESTFAAYGTIASVVVYMVVYGVGSPVPWITTSELFNTKVVSWIHLNYKLVLSVSTSRRHSCSLRCVVIVFHCGNFVFALSRSEIETKCITKRYFQWVGVSLSYTPFIFMSALFTIFFSFTLRESTDGFAAEKAAARRMRSDSYLSNLSVI
ncbi:MFS transporter, SP family [Aphelenchoides besseyi]|nr:MFS transporter, SP family [Aphelenchoides besseyi]